MRNKNIKVHYVGLLRSPSSWAKVGREMVLALKNLGCDITASSTKGYLYRRDFALHPELQKIISPAGEIDVCLAFEYPPNCKNLRGRKKIAFLVYEASLLPKHWVKPINDYIDILIVPSTYCFTAFKKSGVDAEKMRIVPYGFNPEHFRPCEEGGISREEFRFLFVGTPHKRKVNHSQRNEFFLFSVRLVIARIKSFYSWHVRPIPIN